MFDLSAFDLLPLLVAPFVAVFVGAIFYLLCSAIGLALEKGIFKKRSYWSPVIALLSLAIIPFACFASVSLGIGGLSPAPWFQPTTDDIVGKWQLTPQTIQFFRDGYNFTVIDHEWVFDRDGTFWVRQVPIFWGSLDDARALNEEYISGSGSWHFGQIEGTERNEWVVFAQFSTINGQSSTRLMRFYFEGHLPPYTLVALDSANVAFRFRKK